MKSLFIFFAIILFPAKYVFSQFIPPVSEGIHYSHPERIDSSSQNFAVGISIDKTNKDKYAVLSSQYNYMGNGYGGWTNILFYNSQTRIIKKLFPEKNFIYIYPLTTFYTGISSYENQNLSIICSKFILLSVRTDDYNKDGIIDDADPVSLFICNKAGDKTVQLNPKYTNVTAWTMSLDGKTIIMKLEKDENADKKFKNEDELLYQINLDDDFTKISLFPISVN